MSLRVRMIKDDFLRFMQTRDPSNLPVDEVNRDKEFNSVRLKQKRVKTIRASDGNQT